MLVRLACASIFALTVVACSSSSDDGSGGSGTVDGGHSSTTKDGGSSTSGDDASTTTSSGDASTVTPVGTEDPACVAYLACLMAASSTDLDSAEQMYGASSSCWASSSTSSSCASACAMALSQANYTYPTTLACDYCDTNDDCADPVPTCNTASHVCGTCSGAGCGSDAGSGDDDAGSGDDNGDDAGNTGGTTYSGQATYYDANGEGACGSSISDSSYVAALNSGQYSRSVCGKCAHVTGPNGSVTVKIEDECPGCHSDSMDLSESAFEQIASLSAGRVSISWYWTTCD